LVELRCEKFSAVSIHIAISSSVTGGSCYLCTPHRLRIQVSTSFLPSRLFLVQLHETTVSRYRPFISPHRGSKCITVPLAYTYFRYCDKQTLYHLRHLLCRASSVRDRPVRTLVVARAVPFRHYAIWTNPKAPSGSYLPHESHKQLAESRKSLRDYIQSTKFTPLRP